ncbi:peptide chain release factor N(5)-glutamine methyltransferase [Avibacterium sp. 21-586]|uniref:peptide chain release factor N(5)-glutamine methyltransferase n=1 Tax=Avibacterium sp. 21-586 TaxID=2911534 RepID=UPI002245C87E|nr:peptide chain release factor N(5)-glutamine methyltransferase [Avibacterium sp. 21-586]MCW9709561.1 peptide chain release factor N(5)-glutamine methyltransferase [Avibacterium sp. 21-586]
MNYADWLAFAETQLTGNKKTDPFINPKVDASLLLQFVTGCSRSFTLAFSETLLSPQELAQLEKLLQRRINGEPMAYILGEQPFWSLNLKVSTDTLIPRADTECLVENALDCIHRRITCKTFTGHLDILDLGTGTGAIALALAQELRSMSKNLFSFSVIGIDLVDNAVSLAKENATYNKIENVNFLQSHWFSSLKGKNFDLIVSNPPYIDEKDPHLQLGGVRFEPLSALVAREQGYADLHYIIVNALNYLKPKGWILLEHGWTQGEKVRSFFDVNFWHNIQTLVDYNQNERVTLAQLKS